MINILHLLFKQFKILFFGKSLIRKESHNNSVKVIYFSKNNIFRKIGENKVTLPSLTISSQN